MISHGEHVFTVDLAPENPVPAFKPGQFLHLALDEYDPSRHWPESRVFSIASSPRDTSRIRILYSVIGPYTRRMEQELRPGSAVWIKLPYGEFIIDGLQDVVLVAGGTGISAFTAYLEALKPDQSRRVSLVYGARRADLMIYRPLVADLMARVPNFSAVLFAEQASPGFATGAVPAPGCPEHRSGRISVTGFWPLLEEPLLRVYYLSGPPQMAAALSAELLGQGVPSASIRTDAWE